MTDSNKSSSGEIDSFFLPGGIFGDGDEEDTQSGHSPSLFPSAVPKLLTPSTVQGHDLSLASVASSSHSFFGSALLNHSSHVSPAPPSPPVSSTSSFFAQPQTVSNVSNSTPIDLTPSFAQVPLRASAPPGFASLPNMTKATPPSTPPPPPPPYVHMADILLEDSPSLNAASLPFVPADFDPLKDEKERKKAAKALAKAEKFMVLKAQKTERKKIEKAQKLIQTQEEKRAKQEADELAFKREAAQALKQKELAALILIEEQQRILDEHNLALEAKKIAEVTEEQEAAVRRKKQLQEIAMLEQKQREDEERKKQGVMRQQKQQDKKKLDKLEKQLAAERIKVLELEKAKTRDKGGRGVPEHAPAQATPLAIVNPVVVSSPRGAGNVPGKVRLISNVRYFSLLLLQTINTSVRTATRMHSVALKQLRMDIDVTVCFFFPYFFKFVVSLAMEYATVAHWAPVLLWYSFLVSLFCTDASVCPSTYRLTQALRVILPVCFVAEGVWNKCYALELNGCELLIVSSILSSIKCGCTFHPLYLIVLSSFMLVLSTLPAESTWLYLWQWVFLVLWLDCLYFLDYCGHNITPKAFSWGAAEGEDKLKGKEEERGGEMGRGGGGKKKEKVSKRKKLLAVVEKMTQR